MIWKEKRDLFFSSACANKRCQLHCLVIPYDNVWDDPTTRLAPLVQTGQQEDKASLCIQIMIIRDQAKGQTETEFFLVLWKSWCSYYAQACQDSYYKEDCHSQRLFSFAAQVSHLSFMHCHTYIRAGAHSPPAPPPITHVWSKNSIHHANHHAS